MGVARRAQPLDRRPVPVGSAWAVVRSVPGGGQPPPAPAPVGSGSTARCAASTAAAVRLVERARDLMRDAPFGRRPSFRRFGARRQGLPAPARSSAAGCPCGTDARGRGSCVPAQDTADRGAGPDRRRGQARSEWAGRPGRRRGTRFGKRHRTAPASRAAVAAARYDSIAARSPPGQIGMTPPTPSRTSHRRQADRKIAGPSPKKIRRGSTGRPSATTNGSTGPDAAGRPRSIHRRCRRRDVGAGWHGR